jgi:lipid A 4'-phosphatase
MTRRAPRPRSVAAWPRQPEMSRNVLWFAGAFLVLCGGLVLLPQIDLATSGLFYRPGAGFFLADWAPFRIAHQDLPDVVTGFVIALLALLAATAIRRHAILGLDARAALFLLAALAIGPGFTVNTVFKDHWGRARPAQITNFGGEKKFSRAFVPSDQCARNCSFPAGDPAMGFYLVAFALLAEAPRKRRWGIAAAVTAGAALGIVRLAQGGHFLSDVVASGFIVAGLTWLLHQALIAHDGWGALLASSRRRPPGLRRFLWLTLGAVVLASASYAWIDRPLAQYFHGADPSLHATFAFITKFGEGGVYLVPLGLIIIAALIARRRLLAWRAGFVFAALAIPGLLVDIFKPVFGRARPQLLFAQHLFGFTWSGPHADRWSFPSGHSVTIAALAVALYAIYPPLWPAYAALALLVMASRIIVDAHYLSDVIAGGYIGLIGAWALAAALRQRGVPLSLVANDKLKDSP